METDEISRYLAALEREDCYRVDATLKESPHEVTQRVFFTGANGAERGPYVRKFIDREAGMGAAYERIFEAQQRGQRFKHIPVLLECYRHEDLLVVVMEFVAGETLQDLVYRRDPSMQLAVDVFPSLCDAVTELHESFDPPIIHRDLKPSNVMLADGGLTIIDFGIAREFREGADADTVKFGTRAFAPPEQFGFGQTTVRSDVYALGMLLYYCLTEKIPTPQARDAGFALDNVAPHLRPVLIRATDLDPAERYASAAELKAAFLEAAAKNPNPGKQPRKRRAAIAGICAATALVGIALFGTTVLFGHSDQPANEEAGSTQASASTSASGSQSTAQTNANETAASVAVDGMQTSAPPRNGFDPATNFTVTLANVTFQIPRCFNAKATKDDSGNDFYYAETGSSVSMIMTSETHAETQGNNLSDEEIESAKNSYLGGLIKSNEETFAEVISSIDCELAGLPTRIVTLKGTVQGFDLTTKVAYFIDADAGTIGTICFGQTSNAQFDYSADFAKTIASAK